MVRVRLARPTRSSPVVLTADASRQQAFTCRESREARPSEQAVLEWRGRGPCHLTARCPPGKEEGRDACCARERPDDAAWRCAAASQMARAGIEPATPRFSVVCSTN